MAIFLWYLLLFFLLIQAYFVFVVFLPLLKAEKKLKRIQQPVTVIICAKNEAQNLKKNLKTVLMQKYPIFEVLVMDDHSTDTTENLVKEFQREFNNLSYYKASESSKNKEGKKFVLSEAISKSQHEILLLTDADCRPASLSWIDLMTSKIGGKIKISLGIGQYEGDKSWVNKFIQYETMFTAISYLSFANFGKPYMGVGRNVAYDKSLFKIDKLGDLELAGGDDDLFIQNVANEQNTAICTDVQSHTYSKGPSSFKEWINQKTRHYSTSFYYKNSVKVALILMKTSLYLPNFLMLILFFVPFHSPLIAVIFFIRYFLYFLVFSAIKRRLGFSKSIYLLPCFEIYFSLFDTCLTIKNLKKKRTTWL